MSREEGCVVGEYHRCVVTDGPVLPDVYQPVYIDIDIHVDIDIDIDMDMDINICVGIPFLFLSKTLFTGVLLLTVVCSVCLIKIPRMHKPRSI